MCLRCPIRQRQDRPVQAVGVAGDVDRVDAMIGSDPDFQQELRPPTRRDRNARNTVDEQHHTRARPLGELTSLLGDRTGPAQLGRHITRHQRPINPAHHVGGKQLEQRGDIAAAGSRQKRFDDFEVTGWTAGFSGRIVVQPPPCPACELLRRSR